jgi:uncharacterized protein YjbJ (UPF0337 family)
MALSLNIREFPGYQMMKNLYDALPGSGIVKKVVVGLVIGAAVVGIVGAGIAFFVGASAFLLTLPLLVQLGVIISIAAVFTLIVVAVQTVYNFNFAISDEEIESQIKAKFDQYYGRVGEILGKMTGYLVCGALPGTLALCFNKTMAAAVFENLTEEAKDEIAGDIAAIARSVLQMLVQSLMLKGFKSARKWIKRPGTPLHDYIKKSMGAKNFEKWGKEKFDKPFTIAGKVEEKIENIKDPKLKDFAENFLEGLTEGCVEAGYIVASTMDAHIAAQAMVAKRMGLSRTDSVVRIAFDR